MLNFLQMCWGYLIANKDLIELIVFLTGVFGLNVGSARGVIAVVNEMIQAGALLNDKEALQKASDLVARIKIGKFSFSFLPEFMRKGLIQMVFDSMKRVQLKEMNKLKSTQAVAIPPSQNNA